MKRKIAALWLSWVILFGFIVIIVEIAPPVKAKTIYVDDSGGADHKSIQDAINASYKGDTVYVYSGTYYENVVVNKSINLIGEDSNTTIVDGGGNGDVVRITVDGINIRGFNITNGDNGIYFLTDTNNVTIIDNVVYSNNYGIYLDNSGRNTITDNNISNNRDGIYLISSSNNNLTNNNVSNNWEGIYLFSSSNNNLTNNNVSNNWDGINVLFSNGTHIADNNVFNNWDDGINLCSSIGNNITGNTMIKNGIIVIGDSLEYWNTHNIDTSNTVDSKPVYYWKNQTGGTVPIGAGQVILANCTNVKIVNQELTNGSIGIELGFSSYNNVTCNNISLNNIGGIFIYSSTRNNIIDNSVSSNYLWVGIYLEVSAENNITNNNFSNNSDGIWLSSSNGNNITGNTISSNNQYGIFLQNSNNRIFHNNFITNQNQAYDDGTSTWDEDYPVGGNYWSDWTTPDNDNDGFVDNPRTIDGGSNQDNYPFTVENGWISEPPTYPVHNIDTDEYFITIQAAIDDPDTLNGHTIEASSRMYYENVLVNKMINLIGEDRESTIINGLGSGDVINVSENWVNITGFTIINSGSDPYDEGIELFNVQNCRVISNNIFWNNCGITVYRSSNNSIACNNASNNYYDGIRLGYTSSNNNITGNNLSNNYCGINFYSSSNNNIIGNNIWSIVWGVYFSSSSENNIIGNEILDSSDGIHLGSSSNNNIVISNNILNGANGIRVSSSSDNNLIKNNISNNTVGIYIDSSSSSNNITGNKVSLNNPYGIYLSSSNGNNITNNTVSSNNDYGIFLQNSNNSRIYHNNFIANPNQAYDDGDNQWDNGYPSGGNYWSDFDEPGEGAYDDYQGEDQNVFGSDGIVDNGSVAGGGKNPYIICDDNQDDYPLIEPWGLDEIPPIIYLISPSNNSIIKAGTLIDLSVSDLHLYQVTYSLNGGPDQALTSPYDIDTTGWTDTNYILEIYAIDTYNNLNTKWFNFTIDSIPPSITLSSPHNNSYIIWNVEINLTISDNNLDQVTYIKDGDGILYLSFPYNIDTDSWEDGRHVIEVTAEDLAGNLRKEQYVFTKDTTPPVITLDSPENNTIITEDMEIYFTITDENLDAVYYRINNNSYILLAFPYHIYTKGWQDGRYVIDIIAVDLASIGDIDQYVFTKDTAWPEIILNSPENNTLLIQASTLDFDISDVNLDFVTYSVNQGTFHTLEEPYDIPTLGWDDGLYTIKIRAEDVASHVSEKWFIFWIDTSPPSISSTSPVDGGSDVAIDGKITIEFNEPMDCESVESAISTTPYFEYMCIWANDNKTLTLNFLEPLEYDTLYQIVIKSKAEDLAGRKLEGSYEFEFTTVGKPEDKDEWGFPIILILALLMVIIVVGIIVALIISKKKRTSAGVVEARVEPITTIQPIQFTCSNCNNLLQVNDTGMSQNVICPFCSTLLTVQSQKGMLQIQQTQQQPQQQIMQISCPSCKYVFSILKTTRPMQIQCPNCWVKGTLR